MLEAPPVPPPSSDASIPPIMGLRAFGAPLVCAIVCTSIYVAFHARWTAAPDGFAWVAVLGYVGAPLAGWLVAVYDTLTLPRWRWLAGLSALFFSGWLAFSVISVRGYTRQAGITPMQMFTKMARALPRGAAKKELQRERDQRAKNLMAALASGSITPEEGYKEAVALNGQAFMDERMRAHGVDPAKFAQPSAPASTFAPAPSGVPNFTAPPAGGSPQKARRELRGLSDAIRTARTNYRQAPDDRTKLEFQRAVEGYFAAMPGQELAEAYEASREIRGAVGDFPDPAMTADVSALLDGRLRAAEPGEPRATIAGVMTLWELGAAREQLRSHRSSEPFAAYLQRMRAAAALWTAGEEHWKIFVAEAPRTAAENIALIAGDYRRAQPGVPADYRRLKAFLERFDRDRAFAEAARLVGEARSFRSSAQEREAGLNRAVKLAPDYAEAWLALAWLHGRRQPKEAAVEARKGVELIESGKSFGGEREADVLSDGYVTLGRALRDLGRTADAAAAADRALTYRPNSSAAGELRRETAGGRR